MANDQGIAYLEGPQWDAKYKSFFKVGKKEAREINQRVFWPSAPCDYGHVFWRYTSSGVCVWCQRGWNVSNAVKRSNSGSKMLDIDAKLAELALKREIEAMDL